MIELFILTATPYDQLVPSGRSLVIPCRRQSMPVVLMAHTSPFSMGPADTWRHPSALVEGVAGVRTVASGCSLTTEIYEKFVDSSD